MYNANDGDVKRLLSAKLLTIIAAISTRLMDDELKEHLIIPVS
jgi:hypothetical protein